MKQIYKVTHYSKGHSSQSRPNFYCDVDFLEEVFQLKPVSFVLGQEISITNDEEVYTIYLQNLYQSGDGLPELPKEEEGTT